MFKHYVKIALRAMQKQRMYSAINITGLAVGLACCLFILIYIQRELSYDRHYADADRLYRVVIEFTEEGKTRKNAVTSTPLAETLVRDYAEVELAGRIAPQMFEAGSNLVRTESETQNRFEEGFVYADASFMELFQFPMIEGDLNTALSTPFSMVITERKARHLFGAVSPIGQPVILNNNTEQPFTVTGVMEDLPSNTHLEFNYLLSMEGLRVSKLPNWSFVNYITYARLAPETDIAAFESGLSRLVETYQKEDFAAAQKNGRSFTYLLQPVTDVHLRSTGIAGFRTYGDIQYLWLFGAVAVFILLIAAVNFMNLSTARSANRAREIGLRKVFGSVRPQLIIQFLTESMLVSLLAMVLGGVLVWQLMPFFGNLTGQQFDIPWSDWRVYAVLLGFTVVLGILAGAYPSLFLSNFRPIRVLKGKLSSGSKSSSVRSALVVFQFATSIVLIISSLVVWRQMGYIQNKKLGFEKEQVLIVEDSYTLNNQVQAFKEQVQVLADVEHVSVTNFLPVKGYSMNRSGSWPAGSTPEDSEVNISKWFVDYDYVKTMGLQVLEGRDFSRSFLSDSQAIILNQKAADLLGFENPVGERISSYTRIDTDTGELIYDTYTIVGIVEDFHFESLKNPIDGLSLVLGNSTGSTLIKTNTQNLNQTLSQVKEIWASFAPNQAFRYSFLDDRFASMYTFEQRAGNVLAIFTGLAIFVACLGLFALAAFMAEQRLQEISIRKVLGASVKDIVLLLTKNFARLVMIALVVAVPLGWLLMNQWLEDFAYRVSISWDVFVVAGWLALIIAIATISYQAIKVAIVNPASILRGE